MLPFAHTLFTLLASIAGRIDQPAFTQNQLVTARSDHLGQHDSVSIPISATNSSITSRLSGNTG
jgi:hypothetical protein